MLKPNSQVTTNLIKARELIADEKNWCKRDIYAGNRVCAIGALRRAAGVADEANIEAGKLLGYHPLYLAAQEAGFSEPAFLNDASTHAATIAMFSRAIELSLQDG